MRDRLEILPIRGIGEVGPDSDLAELITTAAPWLRDGDVLVVTSKIISKAEGQLVDVPTAGPEREAAREELLAAETARMVARRGHTRIVQTHHGFVMASAGIDASNVERSRLVLLPKDPDASARGLRAALRERYGLDVAVIVSDTMGRPWRNGLTDVALGAAGIDPIRDYRGEYDSYGNEMHVTQVAVVDELSAAGDLVKGKFDQVPVAVVRGYLPAGGSDGVGASGASGGPRASGRFGASGGVDGLGGLGATGDGPGDLGDLGDGPGATVLVREAQYDLFSMGTAEARAAGLKLAATLGDTAVFGEDTVDLQTVARAIASVTVAPTTIAELAESTQGLAVRCRIEAPTPEALVALGIDVHRIRCALAAEGLASAWRPTDGLIDIGRPA